MTFEVYEYIRRSAVPLAHARAVSKPRYTITPIKASNPTTTAGPQHTCFPLLLTWCNLPEERPLLRQMGHFPSMWSLYRKDLD